MDEKLKDIIGILNNSNVYMPDINKDNYLVTMREIAADIDSLLYISIMVGIEEKYNIELPDDVLNKNIFENIDDFIILLNDEINKQRRKEDNYEKIEKN